MPVVKDPSKVKASIQNRSVAQGVTGAVKSLPAVPALVSEETKDQNAEARSVQLKSEYSSGANTPPDQLENTSAPEGYGPSAQFNINDISPPPDSSDGSQPDAVKPIQRQENKTGLPDNLKSGIENMSGYDMNDVKVHYNSSKPAQLQALAYAQGTDIHIGSGQEKHLPHEAWHVVQQKQGRVKPTLQMKQGVAVNDDAGLEKEANVMGERALTQHKSIEPNTDLKQAPVNKSTGTAQMLFGSEEYQPQWQPGMAGLGAAKASAETGWEGAKGAAGLGLQGMEGSKDLAMAGAEGAFGLGAEGASGAMDLAGEGIDKSMSLAGQGVEGSLELAGKGIEASGEAAMTGAMISARLGMSGIKGSGKLAKAGAEGSLSLAKSGIEASGDLAAAPARWAAKGMAGTNSKLKKAGYAVGGALGSLVSAPLGLAGAVGSGALGLTGAAGSGALGAVGAIGSGALGAAGTIGSGALGAVGAIGSGALGAAGAVGSGALGLTGATLSAGLGVGAATGSLALGTAGAVGAGALGAAGAVGSGALGLTGAVGAGTLGLTGAALAGTGGGLAMAGGGIYKGGKMAADTAGSTLNKGLLGQYDAGASHPVLGDKLTPGAAPGEFEADGKRKNYGETTGREGMNYALLGGSGASAVGASITDMASKGNVIGESIRDKGFVSPISGGAEAFGGLGAVGGILGAGAALMDSAQAGKSALDSSGDKATRTMAGAQSASSLIDATKSSASAAYNIASLVDAKGAAAAGAQIAAGGAAIAMGAIDMIRGGYGAFTAHQREQLLIGIQNAPGTTDEIKNIAKEAIATQQRAKVTAGGQVLKGAIGVAGGVLLAASMATPIGWMILGIGAAVGIAVALKNWYDKRNQKKVVVMRELGVTDAMDKREKDKEAIKNRPGHGPLTKKRKEAIKALGNPLQEALSKYGFSSVGHCYSNYINATANKIYNDGVVAGMPEYESIISSIGLKIEKKGVDTSKWKPTPEKIAKALSG